MVPSVLLEKPMQAVVRGWYQLFLKFMIILLITRMRKLFLKNNIYFYYRLTAFVAKSFKQAEKYITVDEKIVSEALQWLAEKQAANGSFPEVGTVSHRDMQGGAAKGLALTAYVLSAFLEGDVS